ncbi:MAG: bifunctional 5,10-methylenetetrahydrofolate dehydrogenase/5,10-methenyltetrahydrofolate cyclohydrolase [Candidatus Brockarchaeota archaeon]|nr:bifunctional 5,10-methylenetetrahydrofolate dehydrogenase/5,10-methenyltetrahydrofolate cyclohydrolase [Candidatus Brockarchaeota archaeon]
MNATIIDGRKLSAEIKATIKEDVKVFEGRGAKPCLATILVGSDQASSLYVSLKHKACQEVGIKSLDYKLPEGSSAKEIEGLIGTLNSDEGVHGILVQLPIPKPIDVGRIMGKISPDKDVDGLNPCNIGSMVYGGCRLVPCTPAAVMVILARYSIGTKGRHAVIISRSAEVGKPLAILLLNQDATVTVCHSKTRNVEEHAKGADILVSGVGRRPEFVVGESMVKAGSAVIDIGTNKVGGKVCGDVDFEAVLQKVSHITPVPGGVGPMTVAMLLRNTLVAAAAQEGIPRGSLGIFDEERWPEFSMLAPGL